MRTASRTATALATILLAAGCTALTSGNEQGLQEEKRGPAGVVPAGLERFYGQTLAWGSCEPYATTGEDLAAFRGQGLQCARVEVPLDYTDPDGRTINLGLLRRPAGDPERRIGALLINPGGPGASGMSAAANLAPAVAGNELGQRFDLVGFDPRGVGASQPQVRCLTDEERDADRLDLDVDTSPEGVAQTEAETRDYVAKCVERTGTDVLAQLGTRDVARDLDVLRSVLGDEKLTYLGYSYGTRIGTAYAEMFPHNVRALVLDGAVDPSQDLVEQLVAQAAGFQRSFDAFAASCTAKEQCPLGNDPAQAVSRFRALVDPLLQQPVPAGNGRNLSYNDAQTGVIQALYSEQLWSLLEKGLSELAQGRGDTLMLLADTYYGRGEDGRYTTVLDALTAVRCVDDPRVTDRAVVAEADRRYREAAPFLDDGNGPSSALDACAFWPVPPTSEPHQVSVPGLPQVLVISTTGDPATPYQAGVDLAKMLNARLLTYEGDQHTVALQGVPCVDEVVVSYLVDLRLPETNTTC